MPITPDHTIYWHWGFTHLNATIVFTWAVMLLLTLVSWLVTRRLEGDGEHRSRWQNALEAIVEAIRGQIRQMCPRGGDTYLPFVGTLFLFIAVSNLLEIVPGWHAPTGSLSTTSALAICVGVAVPVFGILRQGVAGYFRHYLRPSFIMLPFHLISETSRNLALAIRLFGNIMSGSIMVAILLAIAPLFFPLLMHALGLMIGLIQAYIFAVLAMVYIAAAVQSHREQEGETHG
jgi:F-type H+-transporting ATPase subunit a